MLKNRPVHWVAGKTEITTGSIIVANFNVNTETYKGVCIFRCAQLAGENTAVLEISMNDAGKPAGNHPFTAMHP